MGWLFFVAYSGLTFQGLNYGGGSDLWNVSKADYKKFVAVSSQAQSKLHESEPLRV